MIDVFIITTLRLGVEKNMIDWLLLLIDVVWMKIFTILNSCNNLLISGICDIVLLFYVLAL